MANISVNVVDGNNINLVLTPPQTQTITIDRSVSGPTGPIGMNWKGNWSSATTYAINDGVYDNGSSYICIAANTNQEPPNLTYWNIVAQKGSNATGTVSSVALSAPAFLSVSGSPITSSGTLALSYSGTALPVANGGTGVTASTGANSVVLRDANANISINSISEGYVNVAAAGTTTVLTVASAPNYVVTGSGGQTYQLPDATTLINGVNYVFNNNQSSGTIVVKNNSSTTVATIQSGGYVEVVLLSNSIAAGTWDVHNQAPSNVSWSTNTFDYPGSITSATWNGVAVAVNRGGTGASTAQAAINTLAGGVTSGSYLRGNGTNVVLSAIQTTDVPTLNQNTTGTAANVTGTVAVANGGTGLTTTPANGALDIGNGTGFTRTTLTAGSGISVTNASGSITITSTGGGGTVTSVSATVPTFLSITGSPITTSGTLAISYSGTALPVLNGGTGVTTSTGSGSNVLSTSPSLTTPALAGETFSTGTGIAAAGTTQATATALTNDYNVVSTVGASAGVALPTATIGRKVIVVNTGVNVLSVYPASGGTIDLLAANAAISIPVNGTLEFNAATTTQWYSTSTSAQAATSLTGIVAIANGGTNTSATATAGAIPYGTGTALAYSGVGTTGQVLTSNGSSAPTWATASSGGTASFTATGAIANGAPVSLRSDGTVETTTTTSYSNTVGTVYSNASITGSGYFLSAYSITSNKFLCVYYNTSGYLAGVVTTVSAGVISYGTPTVLISSGCVPGAITWNANNDSFGVLYRNTSNNYVTSVVVTISGTTPTAGTPFSLGVQGVPYSLVIATDGYYFATYTDISTTYAMYVKGTISITTFGSTASGSIPNGSVIHTYGCYAGIDLTNNNIVVVFLESLSGSAYVAVLPATFSAGVLTFGTKTNTVNQGQSRVAPLFISANKFYVSYSDGSGFTAGNVGTIASNAIALNSTTITFSSGTTVTSNSYNSTADKVVLVGYGSSTANYAVVSISGTTPSIASNFASYYSTASGGSTAANSTDATVNVVLLSTQLRSINITPAYVGTNATSCLGIAAQAISSTATGNVTIIGGINTSVTGLTTNNKYYVQANGTLATTNAGYGLAGRALSATKILITSS